MGPSANDPSRATYNLGFFFGPGRPFSFAGPLGSMLGGARLRPATCAPPRFFLPSILGGASELLSVPSAVAGTGVALDSEGLSAESGG